MTMLTVRLTCIFAKPSCVCVSVCESAWRIRVWIWLPKAWCSRSVASGWGWVTRWMLPGCQGLNGFWTWEVWRHEHLHGPPLRIPFTSSPSAALSDGPRRKGESSGKKESFQKRLSGCQFRVRSQRSAWRGICQVLSGAGFQWRACYR